MIVLLSSRGVKNVLNRSFIIINSLIPCVFALLENKIPARERQDIDLIRLILYWLVVFLVPLSCVPSRPSDGETLWDQQ